MKIGIDITPIIYEGTGVGDYTRHLVTRLLKQNSGDEFVLFYSTLRGFGKVRKIAEKIAASPSRKLVRDPRNDKVRIVGIPIPPWVWQFVWNKLDLIKIETFTGKLDVFHCWDYLVPPSNCKRVVTIHDATPLLFPETHTKKIIKNYELLITKIKAIKIQVVTVSENSKKDLVKFGIDENLIAVVYNGNNFPADESKIEYQKENYILAVGNRNPRKNLKSIIDAFASIADKYPSLELRIAGNYGWGEDDELRIKNYELGIKERIKILGYVSDDKLVELYRKATCLVYPSLYEGFGLPILEAMSLGCPVITSSSSSMPEVGRDAVLYVDPKNVEELSTTMIRIIESTDLQKDLIKKGIEQAKRFSWEKCAKETRKIYDN
jgi:glycosyltransferase involved in cell wall biosynthesis